MEFFKSSKVADKVYLLTFPLRNFSTFLAMAISWHVIAFFTAMASLVKSRAIDMTSSDALLRRTPPGRKPVIVQLFEWNWDSVASECTEFIGPNGYGYVQVSPAQEHVEGPEWWTDYQPVSYKIQSKRGDRAAFKKMIDVCRRAGVKVIADTIWNHMSNEEQGVGVGGSSFSHYEYPGLYFSKHFHHEKHQISNYYDKHEIQFSELNALADLATEQEYVQRRLAAYGNDLLSLGVAGLRLDAVKHIPSDDLRAIISHLDPQYQPYITQELIYYDGPVTPAEYLDVGDVQEFRYAAVLRDSFLRGNIANIPSQISRSWIPSDRANTFVANHDTERDRPEVLENGDVAGHPPIPLYPQSPNNAYRLANVFLLAWPYGSPTVYSGYKFTSKDQGAPRNGAGDCHPHSGWNCDHRFPEIVGMVHFYNEVNSAEVTNLRNDEANRIAFGRDRRGFVAINHQSIPWTADFKTDVPDGVYCDVVSGGPNGGLTRDGGCAGNYLTVSDGHLKVTVPKHSAVALHVGARPRNPPATAEVKFCLSRETPRLGTHVYVVGDLQELGSESRSKAIRLQPSDYPHWEATVDVPLDAQFAYHYLIMDENKNEIWRSPLPRAGEGEPGWQDENCPV